MKSRVKTRHLRHFWKTFAEHFDRRNFFRHVLRVVGAELAQFGEHLCRDRLRRAERRSAVNDAMPDRQQAAVGGDRFRPVQKNGKRLRMVLRFDRDRKSVV